VKAYKFLRAGRVAPFSGVTWPDGEWVEADGPLGSCRTGVHACRPEHLAYWVMDELWEIELDGELVEAELKLVARRGRLAGRVEAWDDGARGDFAVEGVRRAAHYAVLELREVGLEKHAAALEGAATLDDHAEQAGAAAETAAAEGEADAADLASFVADAAAYAQAGHFSGPAFIAARAADVHAPVGVDDPFAAERAAQGAWLARRLGLLSAADA
jgi:hypothetical protein